MCQVVRLTLPDLGLVIQEDWRLLTVDFDLSADFTIEANLTPASVGEGSGSTTVDDYINACKCDGAASFTCDSSPLLPNNELMVCVWSVSPDVQIDFLDSMVSIVDYNILCTLLYLIMLI